MFGSKNVRRKKCGDKNEKFPIGIFAVDNDFPWLTVYFSIRATDESSMF